MKKEIKLFHLVLIMGCFLTSLSCKDDGQTIISNECSFCVGSKSSNDIIFDNENHYFLTGSYLKNIDSHDVLISKYNEDNTLDSSFADKGFKYLDWGNDFGNVNESGFKIEKNFNKCESRKNNKNNCKTIVIDVNWEESCQN